MTQSSSPNAPVVERRATRFRLYPSSSQAAQMARFAGACRFVYNLALEQRRDWWRQHRAVTGRRISYFGQARELTALRADIDWLREAPAAALQQALRDLDQAFQNFFCGRAGFPTPRRKGVHDTFRFSDTSSFRTKRTGRATGLILLPKLGWVHFRGWRTIPGALRNVTISSRAGQWHAAIQWERDVPNRVLSTLPPVGIDLGVAVFAALSDGTAVSPAAAFKGIEKRLRRAQRRIARKRRGSQNWKKQKARIARLHRRAADGRKDHLHKVSTAIAKNHGMVVMENLAVRRMSASAAGTVEVPGRNVRAKAGLNRAIVDQGWSRFRELLAYKLPARGGRLVLVDPRNTSRRCSACGYVAVENRPTQARFTCKACSHADNADVNAARNILAAGLAAAACGGCV
ncbi:transposase [Xanthobacter sp. DSM 14520]|uniref:RNA-guided endonuclease InsQ/TnpB family protein n=1 Tax=Xanthobacter autotrophicus (strain ATCC BAA-1158 / Py2) TaxID=78245 RepID=UPI003727E277